MTFDSVPREKVVVLLHSAELDARRLLFGFVFFITSQNSNFRKTGTTVNIIRGQFGNSTPEIASKNYGTVLLTTCTSRAPSKYRQGVLRKRVSRDLRVENIRTWHTSTILELDWENTFAFRTL